MNVVDTSGWTEYFFAGPHARFFAPAIESIGQLIVPTVCLYEVFKKVTLVADEARGLAAVAHMKLGAVCPMTEEVALRAAALSIKHKLPMADSLILATAQLSSATTWTLDEHFRGLQGVRMPA